MDNNKQINRLPPELIEHFTVEGDYSTKYNKEIPSFIIGCISDFSDNSSKKFNRLDENKFIEIDKEFIEIDTESKPEINITLNNNKQINIKLDKLSEEAHNIRKIFKNQSFLKEISG